MENIQIVVYAVVEEYRSVRDKDGNWYEVSNEIDMTSIDRGCSYNITVIDSKIVEFEKILRKLRTLKNTE